MQYKYEKHFLLSAKQAVIYAKERLDYFDKDAQLDAQEIGDGNINYVFKVWDVHTKKSLVIKQADIFLRSSGRPLDLYRNKIEAEILKMQGELAEGFVPEIYFYDETMYALSMQDISDYKNLRSEMMDRKTFGHLADNISEFLASTLLPTTDLVLDRAKKKNNVKKFINIELCDISEDLVFTEPYYNYKSRNIILPQNLDFVKSNLYDNEILKSEVCILRNNFMNNAQALIHGDLHSGSIFIKDVGIKVIDPEFAFYGPIGYDVGNVIGNLFFAFANAYYTDQNNSDFLSWIEKTIVDTFNFTKEKLFNKYDALVGFELYKNKTFKNQYLTCVLQDSLGYAGTEIIRRVVGDSKVKEITCIKDNDIRATLEKSLITIGADLIQNRKSQFDISYYTNKFKQIIKEI